MSEQNNTEVGVINLSTQESTLEARVLRIEKILMRAGYLPKEHFEGDPITDGIWVGAGQPGGIAGFDVQFTYRCQSCHQVHNGKTFVAAKTKDGLTYNILGDCGEYSPIKIWKNPPAGV